MRGMREKGQLDERTGKRINKAISSAWSDVKGLGRKTRALAAALPLVASSMLPGCPDIPEECDSENTTTITLSQAPDGVVPTMAEIEDDSGERAVPLPIVDLVNEIHALSTGSIPPETTVTIVPDYCTAIISGEGGAYVDASYHPNHIFSDQPFTLLRTRMLLHELGHSQELSYVEIPAVLNVYEQVLMGCAAYSIQSGLSPDLIRWTAAARFNEPHHMALYTHYGIFDSSYFSREGPDARLTDFIPYVQANAFVLFRLLENGGDFGAIRTELHNLSYETSSSEDAAEELISRFSEDNYPSRYPEVDIDLELNMAFFLELHRRFGFQVAMDFLDASSYFQIWPTDSAIERPEQELYDFSVAIAYVPEEATIGYGLEGQFCTFMAEGWSRELLCQSALDAQDDEFCALIGADSSRYINALYCCFTAEEVSGEVVFSKSINFVNTYFYYNEDARVPVESEGFRWNGVMLHDVYRTAPIGSDDRCE